MLDTVKLKHYYSSTVMKAAMQGRINHCSIADMADQLKRASTVLDLPLDNPYRRGL